MFSFGYDFHAGNGTAGTGTDNGNIWNLYHFRDRTRDQSFDYDQLNRLISAQNAGTDCTVHVLNNNLKFWGNTYSYDAWGNLTQKSVSKYSAENLSLTALVNNQLSAYGYDAAGNMTSDATDGVSSSYDAENRIASATKAGLTTSYLYDADGNRVKKSSGSTGTLYWYMTPGIVAESDLSGNLKSEYVLFNGERVARRDLVAPGGVFYYFSDHLKTASVITDSAGNIKSESDYYPWGGELQFVGNDSNHYKFTGKERDAESGLDYFGARYYSNGLGRFITPDWAAKADTVPYSDFSNPQTLNLYRYPSNPETYADVDGHQSLDAQRKAAVRDAWKQERARVAAGKPGTVNWTAAEKAELLQTGKVSGYVGHHINSVNGHPELARDPNNIKFVKGAQGNLAEHGGSFRNSTSGELMNRSFIAVQIIGILVQALGDYKFNQHESETGLHSDALYGVRVSNVDKAAQTLAPGAQITTPGGVTFRLGKDHIWRNSEGDTIHYDPKDGKNHLQKSCRCA